MKLNDVKHNHSLTDLLKILIFSILMMIPFIDVGVRCAYVVCNKNAYQSYSGENTTELAPIEEVYDINGNEYGNVFKFTQDDNTENITEFRVQYTYIEYLGGTLTQENVEKLANSNQIYVYYSDGYRRLLVYSTLGNFYVNSQYETFQFKCSGVSVYGNYNDYSQYLYYYKINDFVSLDNVFDYSVNKLTTSELYTWTQQTAIYTGIQTMCTHLSINNTVIPLLLVYWFILTIIYIIIDIVLKLFTMLTHAIGSKTA